MAKLLWAVAANRVIIDSQNNSVSYIDLIEGFLVPAFPAALPQITLGTLWKRDKQEVSFALRIRVCDSDGKQLGQALEVPAIQFVGTQRRHRVNLGIAGVPIPQSGEYSIVIESGAGGKWIEVCRLPLDIEPGMLTPDGRVLPMPSPSPSSTSSN